VSEEESSRKVSQVPKGEIEEITQIETPEETGPICPVPPEHVKLFQDCCERYQKGEMTDLDVMIEVATTLKGLKKME